MRNCVNFSVTESLSAGVPQVLMAVFDDQLHNAAVALQTGIALTVSRATIHTKGLVMALNRVATESNFKNRTIKYRLVAQGIVLNQKFFSIFMKPVGKTGRKPSTFLIVDNFLPS